MTRDEINALDLDALNVECAKALGWRFTSSIDGTPRVRAATLFDPNGNPCASEVFPLDCIISLRMFLRHLPHPSSDIGAAWALWVEMYPTVKWAVMTFIFGSAPELVPERICRAFLMAKNT